MATTREMPDEAVLGLCCASGTSVQVGTDAYEDLRNATSKELLEAVSWFWRQSTSVSLAEAEEIISLLCQGFALTQPGGWERVAPMWLRESRKPAALDE